MDYLSDWVSVRSGLTNEGLPLLLRVKYYISQLPGHFFLLQGSVSSANPLVGAWSAPFLPGENPLFLLLVPESPHVAEHDAQADQLFQTGSTENGGNGTDVQNIETRHWGLQCFPYLDKNLSHMSPFR